MAYEIYTRAIVRETRPTVNISKMGRLGLNRATADIFRKNAVERVLLMFDKEAHRVALRPMAKKDPRAYNVVYGRKDAFAAVSGKGFFKHIGYDASEGRSFSAKWNDRESILEIEIPAVHFKKDKDQPLTTPNVAELKHKRA